MGNCDGCDVRFHNTPEDGLCVNCREHAQAKDRIADLERENEALAAKVAELERKCDGQRQAKDEALVALAKHKRWTPEEVQRIGHAEGWMRACYKARSERDALAAQYAEMRAALEDARGAIARAPNDTWGDVPDTPDRQGWWIRDEMIYHITRVLALPEPEAAARYRKLERVAEAAERFVEHDYRCECPFPESDCTSVRLGDALRDLDLSPGRDTMQQPNRDDEQADDQTDRVI